MGQANQMVAQRRFAKALNFYQEACTKMMRLDYMEGVIECRINEAVTYMKMGKLDQAKQKFRYALSLTRQIGLKRARARVLLQLGLFYIKKKDLDKALDSFDKSIALFRRFDLDDGDRENLSKALAYKGYIFMEKNNLSQAEKFFDQAEGCENLQTRSYLYSNRAELYRRQGDLPSAIASGHKALSLDRAHVYPDFLLYDYHLLARLYRQKGDIDKALEHAFRAYHLALALSHEDKAQEILSLLRKLARQSPNKRYVEDIQRLAK